MADLDPKLKDRLLNDLGTTIRAAMEHVEEVVPGLAPPFISDHTLLRRIGKGSYGEVWLARNALGTFRAVKIVRRQAFDSDRPYEREFAGIRRFEPVSRSHPSQLNVLHVGRDDAAELFYYVMELADSVTPVSQPPTSGPRVTPVFQPANEAEPVSPAPPTGMSALQPGLPTGMSALQAETYSPRTLRSELQRGRRLPCAQCVDIGTALATALNHLHRHGLVHRDIKPSNIIFVNGIPKLADIGLVTRLEATLSFVGTEGYVPPEGPGTPQADIYSLGKVLYEMSTGRDRQDYPELPTKLIEVPVAERSALAELNEVIVKACNTDVSQRYQTAAELHADLALLQSGKSVSRMRGVERRLKFLARAGAAVTGVAALTGLALSYQQYQTREARRLAQVNLELAQEKSHLADEKGKLAGENHQRLRRLQAANGVRAMESGDPALATVWFSEVLKESVSDPAAEQRERFRLGILFRYIPKPTGLFRLGLHPESVGLIDNGKLLLGVGRASQEGERQGQIKVWDVATGRDIRSLSLTNIWGVCLSPAGHWAVVSAPAGNRLLRVGDELQFVSDLPFAGSGELSVFSRDETKLAMCGQNSGCHEVQVFEVPSARPITPPLVHSNEVIFLAFDPAGQQLVTGTRVDPVVKNAGEYRSEPTGEARVWNATTGEPITGWLDFDERVSFAAFSPDGKALVVLGETRVGNFTSMQTHIAKVFDLASGQPRFAPLIHKDSVSDAAFSPNGRYLATACGDHTVSIWDAHSGKPLHEALAHSDPVGKICFGPDGRWLAAVSGREVRLWDVGSGTMALPPLKNEEQLSDVSFDPEGSRLIATARSGNILVWNLCAADPSLPPLAPSVGDIVTSATFSPDGKQVVTDDGAGALQIFQTATGQVAGPRMEPKRETKNPTGTLDHRATWSADGRFLAAPCGDWTVRIWDSRTGEPLPAILHHSNFVYTAEFSPTKNFLVTASKDNTARVWDVVTGQPVTPPMSHDAPVHVARFSPDGQKIVTASDDHTARIWNAQTGNPLTPPMMHGDCVVAAAISPDGRRVATGTGTRDGTVRIWDAGTGQAVSAPLKHLDAVVRVCFSPDGQQLLTASFDRTARVWDVRTGQPVTPPLVHGGFVVACGFSPDGTKVVTGSFDGTARIWDVATGEPLSMPLRHRQAVLDVAFSPEGRQVATASCDGTAQLWDIPSQDWHVDEITSLAELCACEKLGPSGAVEGVTPQEITALWNQVSSRLQGSVLPSPDELIRWHRRRLAGCESSMEWHAAEFHVHRLADLEPGDALARAKLARIQEHRTPPREPGTPPGLIDLSEFYNASLEVAWHPGPAGNDLSELPRGLQTFAETRFDVRGLIQVEAALSSVGYGYPHEVAGIPINRKVKHLHFLQSIVGDHDVPLGTRVGHYVIHFGDGRTEQLDILYGRDGRDWHEWPDQPAGSTEAVVAWKGKNRAMEEAGSLSIRLFKRSWINATPHVKITTLDLVADHPTANPFLVALTAE